jgi:hypothetical protein
MPLERKAVVIQIRPFARQAGPPNPVFGERYARMHVPPEDRWQAWRPVAAGAIMNRGG